MENLSETRTKKNASMVRRKPTMRPKPFFIGLKVENKCLLNGVDIKLHRKRGSGAYGTTFAACWRKNCNVVAKMVPVVTLMEQRAFQLEANIAIKAGEVGVGPKVFKAYMCIPPGEEQLMGVIMMESMKGDVESLVDKKAFNREDVEAVEAVVTRMHQAGIWHSDLHRGNIMYTGDVPRTFRVIDFGMAWPLHGPVPIRLQLTDQFCWMLGRHDLVKGKSRWFDEFISVDWMAMMKRIGATKEDFSVAFRWRIFDPAQVPHLRKSTLQWGPIASFDMYREAAKHVDSKVIVDFADILSQAPYLTGDARFPDIDLENKLKQYLLSRRDS
jgi:predicted Ser/Thr protein kinase